MTWTQALCEHCWVIEYSDDAGNVRVPTRVVDVERTDPETCCQCGLPTWAGIYVRRDPTAVPFPRQEPADA